ncbi:acyltransferase family protein [Winogradskya humida]|uniref:LPS biosynthesis protein n=1 Tax=Winogradskya humida TaxID=113566 RepID=A0ABQ3ZMC6_9ACTN|nr:acyltransferase [Actinoplanes humidus]GIE19342.1 LPS biosynthesis protein [Actinoplanes humidus]
MTHAVRTPDGVAAPPRRGPHRSLNALRTVAAVLVVIYHLRTLLFVPEADGLLNKILYTVTGLGPAAVVVFFVLSGYWVGGSVLSGFRQDRFRWSTYVTARLSRLWIVLVPAIALTALLDHLGLALLPHTSIYLGDIAYHHTVPAGDLAGRLDAGTALGNLAFLQTIALPTYGTNASLWSLAYEAAFYAIFPLALYAWKGHGLGPRLFNGALAVAICVLVGPKVLMYLPVWLMGAVVAMFRTRIGAFLDARSAAHLATARAGAVVLVAGAMAATHASYSGRNVLLLAGTTTLLLIVLVRDVAWSGLPGRVLTAVSAYAESSYSLYAIHLPIAAMTAALLTPAVTNRWAPTAAHWLTLLALTAVLVAIGWAFAWCTERHTDRLRKAADRFIRSGTHRARVQGPS